jgi:hypothetical protein
MLSAADDWVSIEQYGNAKRDWFARFLSLPNGIPSHDTFNRVFSRLDPEQFMNCFLKWVSAWATQNNLVLGQVKTHEKSNEITAIPEFLEALSLTDSLISLDAMGCQKDIAEKIVAQEGDYLLTVKIINRHLRRLLCRREKHEPRLSHRSIFMKKLKGIEIVKKYADAGLRNL